MFLLAIFISVIYLLLRRMTCCAALSPQVGDERVLRGLNQAVLGMNEQEEGVAFIPPALGYTAQVHKACQKPQCFAL